MATTYGMLTSFDSDHAFVSCVGQDAVYQEIANLLARYNALQNEMMAVFVEKPTVAHTIRYKNVIGGEMQTLGRQAAPGAVKSTGYWDVGFPLTHIGDRLASDRVDAAYMTAGELEAQLRGIMTRDTNAVRRDMLAAIFSEAQRTYDDPLHGAITVEPLANGDAIVYPPVVGAAAGAVDDHYRTAAALNLAAMTAAYNDLIEHFGQTQSGDNVIAFCNSADSATIAALAGYTADVDRFIKPGDATAQLLPVPYAPGITIGRLASIWINEWNWIPANYVVFIHLDVPKPLWMRTDPPETGLGTGLQLVATDREHPITNAHYEHRYGFAVANRLNGVVLEITQGDYAEPAYYDIFRYWAP